MTRLERARKLRPIIEKAAQFLDDETSLKATELFPEWSGNSVAYKKDDKVRYLDILYKVLMDHTSQSNWPPSDSPSLFAKVLIPAPGEIPVWEQPDSTNPYMIGDKVHFPTINDPIYESVIDNNIWSPSVYPAGWKEVAE